MIVIMFKYILKYPMKKTLFGLAALLMSLHAGLPVYAQKSINVTIHENGTERQDTIDLPLSMTYPLDSLLNDWKAKNYINPAKDCQTSQENPQFSDSVYIDRLARIPAVMEMPYNDIVRRFIDQYTGRLRTQVSFMLSACNFYMPIFEQALDAYNLPLELKYLPIIESALNPSAMSRAGASGLWQFMLRTGKLYGLESNSLVDERRDPIKSTWAAARYLKDMYDKEKIGSADFGNDYTQSFGNGQSAMIYAWGHMEGTLKDKYPDIDYGIFATPTFGKDTPFLCNSKRLCISICRFKSFIGVVIEKNAYFSDFPRRSFFIYNLLFYNLFRLV